MPATFDQSSEHLPLIPEDILKRHHCHEPLDTRFRSAARLLQSIWREDRGLPMGSYAPDEGKKRKLGSMIPTAVGMAGANFLTPEIAYAVRREVAYREIGAMIEEERLYCNLLSSMPLCYNAFIPLKQNLVHATSFLHEAIPGFAGRVTQILFEHSPGRGNPRFTGDYSAFDLLFRYTTAEGRRGFIAIEVKYSESMREPLAKPRPRYDELSVSCGLFIDPSSATLRGHPLEQLWREHMLAQSMVDADQYDEGAFILIAPELNHLAQQAGELYADHLLPADDGKVRFHVLTLEHVIEVIRLCDPDHAHALHRRYSDWMIIDGELELTFSQLANSLPMVSRKGSTKKAEDAPQEECKKRSGSTVGTTSAVRAAPPF